jgi:hypothetical protein
MTPDLLQRRQVAADRHDQALERWPNRTGDGFVRELRAIIEELSQVAREADGAPGSAAEQARTWRWLGDAFFDLARGSDRPTLEQGRQAYERAEEIGGKAGDVLEDAKRNFSFANTLRALSDGTNVAFLQDARRRYDAALETFRRRLPQAIPQVENALAVLDQQLALARSYGELGGQLDTLKDIQRRLEGGDAAGAEKDLEQFRATRKTPLHVAEETIAGAEALGGLLNLDPAASNQLRARTLDAFGSGKPNPWLPVLQQILAQYRAEVASGKIGPQRKEALDPILRELEILCAALPGDDPREELQWVDRVRNLMNRIAILARQPSVGGTPPAAGSQAARILRVASPLKEFLHGEAQRPHKQTEEAQTVFNLYQRIAKAGTALSGVATDDAAALHLERELFLPLAQEIREYAQRNHLTLATPRWPSPPVSQDPGAVYFSGTPTHQDLLAELCRRRGLHLRTSSPTGHPGQSRWDALRECAVAVMDLSATPGPDLAAVTYDMGLALGLGKSLLIVAAKGTVVPFDVDLTPVLLSGGDGDEDAIDDALDGSLYAFQRGGGDSSVAATIAQAKRSLKSKLASQALSQFADEESPDPLQVRAHLKSALGLAGPEAPQLLLPAFPAAYPDPKRPRCFHVMPFRPDWAKRASSIAKKACDRADVEYVRGDAARDPRIIRSIWDEIARATHVLVDLTDFNANVSLELGIAHALGRNVLLTGQGETIRRLFPALAKERIHSYGLEKGGASLDQALRLFLPEPLRKPARKPARPEQTVNATMGLGLVPCYVCGGSGKIPCTICGGRGHTSRMTYDLQVQITPCYPQMTCSSCGGSGGVMGPTAVAMPSLEGPPPDAEAHPEPAPKTLAGDWRSLDGTLHKFTGSGSKYQLTIPSPIGNATGTFQLKGRRGKGTVTVPYVGAAECEIELAADYRTLTITTMGIPAVLRRV